MDKRQLRTICNDSNLLDLMERADRMADDLSVLFDDLCRCVEANTELSDATRAAIAVACRLGSRDAADWNRRLQAMQEMPEELTEAFRG